MSSQGTPLGKVFAGLDLANGFSWSVTHSHELLEIISDPEPDSGWQMNRSINAGTEIGDACNNTGARPDGLLVQAYWSEAHKACIVPRRPHSITLTYGDNEITGDTVIEEGKAVVALCATKPDTYCYRRHRTTESVTLTATPHHFSTPDLVWSCGGQKITSGGAGAVNISTEVWTPQPHGATSSTRLVTIGVHASGMTLTLTNDPVGGMADGMFTFAVTATVYEAGMASIDASDTAQLAFIGQYLEWDDQYAKDQITCIAEMIRKGRQLILQVGRRIDKGDPLPPWVDQLPYMLGERARGELREIGRMAHYLERAHPQFASELLRVGEISYGLPEGSLHVTGRDRR